MTPRSARSHRMCKGISRDGLTRPARSSQTRISSSGLATSAMTVAVAPHPWVSALEKPNTSANNPNVQVSTPGMSIGARSGSPWLTSRRNATIAVGTASTRLTYRHQRHDSTCGQHTTEQQPNRTGTAGDRPEDPERTGPILGPGERDGQQRQCRRGQQRAECPLQCPRSDEYVERLRQAPRRWMPLRTPPARRSTPTCGRTDHPPCRRPRAGCRTRARMR